MSNPKTSNGTAVKRLARYLKGRTIYVTRLDYQSSYSITTTDVDTDHAGCLRTRRSTSGGLAMLGQHAVEGWSTTQKPLALFSGEAEYYGIARGASNAMGMQVSVRNHGSKNAH